MMKAFLSLPSQGYFRLLAILLFCPACSDDFPDQPEDLGKKYWKAIETNDFDSIYPDWVDIKDLNILMEIVPSIKKYYQKGSAYTEQSLIQAEKQALEDIIAYLKEQAIEIPNWEKQEYPYQKWIKERGIEVGRQGIDIHYAHKTAKVRLIVIYSNHRWQYLGLYSCRVLSNQRQLDENEIQAWVFPKK